MQVKPTQVRSKKLGNEVHSIGRKDETTISEMQCFQENHLEDSFPQSDSQFHEHQVRPFGILGLMSKLLIYGVPKFIACLKFCSLGRNWAVISRNLHIVKNSYMYVAFIIP